MNATHEGQDAADVLERACGFAGCARPYAYAGFCSVHYHRNRRGTDMTKPTRRANGTGTIQAGYNIVYTNGRMKRAHVLVAERAIGRELPAGAVVHHVNGDRLDNRGANLVLCPNDAYHQLLHARALALEVCGDPTWRRCYHCGKWDSPDNLDRDKRSRGSRHPECRRAYARQRHHARKEIANECR